MFESTLRFGEDAGSGARTARERLVADATRRPLGAYYRVDPNSVTDIHVALNEVGILYAGAVCHSG